MTEISLYSTKTQKFHINLTVISETSGYLEDHPVKASPPHPRKCLGITLEQMLNYQKQFQNTKQKDSARNNILQNL